MNATLKNALATFEKLSAEDQQRLAREMEKRAHELWLEQEIAKGEASYVEHGAKSVDQVFERLNRKYGG